MAREAITNRHRPGWKELVATGLYQAGVPRLLQLVSRSYELRSAPKHSLPHWQKVPGPKFAILCYHRIGSGGVPLYSGLPPAIFEAQIRFLRKHYRIVSIDELYAGLRNPASFEQSVTITFDDGYRDLYTQAFPILQKYKIPATIYLTVDAIESGYAAWYDRIFVALQSFPGNQLDVMLERPRAFQLDSFAARINAGVEIIGYLRTVSNERRLQWCASFEEAVPVSSDELANCMLTWEQVKTMHQGGISFGSHTMTHPVFSRVPLPEMERELRNSKELIESKIGSPVRDFAYPFGRPADCDAGGGSLLAQCGYQTAVTTNEGVNTPSTYPYGLRRTQIGEERSLAMFVLMLNQLFLWGKEDETTLANPMMNLHAHQKASRSAGQYERQD
jgi:peptidoglycan/xylan/chitin deacetylase (PgdA/CDA1 family)